jgi:hypothetical protein
MLLGFYRIPHAPITIGKTSNTTSLVTVQGGDLSIPQLVAELGRLMPERWLWEVTQHENNSFIVPFPSRGDLLCSVAFEKAHIKEHNVDLLFNHGVICSVQWPLKRHTSRSTMLICCSKSGSQKKKVIPCLGFRFGFIGCQESFESFRCCWPWASCWEQLKP